MAKDLVPEYRLNDPGKVVGGCSGDFEPENRQPHGALRPGKTEQDRTAREDRPRVIAAKKRAKRVRDNAKAA